MLNRIVKMIIFLPATAYAMEQQFLQNSFIHAFNDPTLKESSDLASSIIKTIIGDPLQPHENDENIIEWAKKYRPQIILHTNPELGISNDLKKYKLLARNEQIITNIQAGNTKKITIKITQEKAINIHTEFISLTKSNGSTISELTIPDTKPTCLKADKQGKKIYIGCADGTVHVYDIEQEKRTQKEIRHSAALEAIDLLDDDQVIITKAGKETFFCSIYDTHPRIALQDVEHSQIYLCKRGVIRSHMGGKSYLSSYVGTVACNDGLYGIPTAYLHGEEPGNNVRKCLLLFLIQKLSLPDVDKDFIVDYCPRIANLPLLDTFEPPITQTLKALLKNLGEQNSTFCGDTTFAPLQE